MNREPQGAFPELVLGFINLLLKGSFSLEPRMPAVSHKIRLVSAIFRACHSDLGYTPPVEQHAVKWNKSECCIQFTFKLTRAFASIRITSKTMEMRRDRGNPFQYLVVWPNSWLRSSWPKWESKAKMATRKLQAGWHTACPSQRKTTHLQVRMGVTLALASVCLPCHWLSNWMSISEHGPFLPQGHQLCTPCCPSPGENYLFSFSRMRHPL